MRTLHTIITFTCIISGLTASAQKIVDKKTAQEVSKLQDKGTELKEGWAKGAAFNASFNQASLTNWFSGGDRKSLGLSLGFKATANLKKGNWFIKTIWMLPTMAC